MKKQITLFLMSLLFIACGNNRENTTVETPYVKPSQVVGIGKVIPQGGIINLASPSSGIVSEIFINVGDSVNKGDLILTLNSYDEELSAREADTRINSQELTVKSAKIALKQERISHKEKQRLLNDAKELLKAGATTGENVRSLESEFSQIDEQLKRAENDLKLQESKLNELKIQRASSQSDIEKKKFTAPIDGLLLDLNPKVGEALNLHQQYARLSPNNPLVVLVEIDELFADQLHFNQSCTIKLPGTTDVAATGMITRISPDLKKKSLFSDGGTDLEDRRIREIEVSINEISKPLFIESKVECTVQLN